MITLRPGISGNSLTGTASVPGVYIRFRDGVVEVKDDEMIRLMKASDGFRGGDFVAADDHGEDPFAETRTSTEPVHVISDIKYGHVENRKVSDSQVKVPAAIKKMIAAEAKKMAKQLLKDPELLKEALREAVKDIQTKESAIKDAATKVSKIEEGVVVDA
jgi:hypothetical protein